LKTYYKGELILTDYICNDQYLLGKIVGNSFFGSNDYLKFVALGVAKNADISAFPSYMSHEFLPASSKFYEVFDILKMPNFKIEYYSERYKMPIVFEKILSEDGIEYGREIHSNLIFPIGKKIKPSYELMREYSHIDLKITYNFSFPSLDKCGCVIYNTGIANQNEVDEYLNMFTGMFKSRKKTKHIAKVTEFYKTNVFNREIKFTEPKPKSILEQSLETKLMEDIELMLEKVKKYNINNYKKFCAEYENLLSGNKSPVNSLCSSALGILLGKIEASLFLEKRGTDDIVKYLEELKVEYLNNFLTDNKITTKISIDDLDKINELFLKTKDEYNLVKQRKIIKDISFIYLLEVKENIDNIDINKLKNGYFSSNIKSVILSLNALSELGFIKKDLIIDLNTDLSVENVLEIIKRIEFNKFSNEKVKELLKIKV